MRNHVLLTIGILALSAAAYGDTGEYSPEELAAIERVKEECEKAGKIDINELEEELGEGWKATTGEYIYQNLRSH